MKKLLQQAGASFGGLLAAAVSFNAGPPTA